MGGHEMMKWDALMEKKQVMFENGCLYDILIDKSYKRITNVKAYLIDLMWLLRRVSMVGNDLWEFPVIKGGNTSVVPRQQVGDSCLCF